MDKDGDKAVSLQEFIAYLNSGSLQASKDQEATTSETEAANLQNSEAEAEAGTLASLSGSLQASIL